MRNFKSIIVLLVLCMFVASCGLYEAMKSDEATFELAVKLPISRLLKNNPDLVDPVYNFSSDALVLIENGSVKDFVDLSKYIKGKINWDKLTVEEQILLDRWILSVGDFVDGQLDKIGGVEAPEEVKAVLMKVTTWINYVALRYIEQRIGL